jgi:predicted nuclease of predicted toxin-antitoxin system
LANGYVVFTHDLDFGTMLALTHATGPSVLQVRGQDVLPEDMGLLVVAALRQHGAALTAGSLVVVDQKKSRVRVLPL